jgi:hypothetical protein|tara:strand:+ start:296 stop:598 length:303 start_codon:yes stop_codon:yes gene_type:complete
MKTYTFLIGTMDDFESIEDLMEHFEGSDYPDSICNCASYEFEAPKECDLSTVQLIGYGLAFENSWSMDDTFSFFIEGTLGGDKTSQMQMHDLWEMPNGSI